MSDIGNIHHTPALDLASKAAARIMETRQPHALTLDDKGNLRTGMVESAPEADLVGVYRYAGLLELSRTIAADVAQAMIERGFHRKAAA